MEIIKTRLSEIQDLRILFLHEGNFQFICNKCHDYGWADTYLFVMDEIRIGYGSVWGTNKREDRDTIFEFYMIKSYTRFSNPAFRMLQETSNVTYVESQSNDLLLTSMLYRYADHINAEAILFEDHFETSHAAADVIFRKKQDTDHMGEDDSDYVLVRNGEVLASGGLMLNYNFPYADIYMQVKEAFRGHGLGCLLVQELKKEAYRIGRVPAARCNINNDTSRATLLKAGFKVCGYRLKGELKNLYI